MDPGRGAGRGGDAWHAAIDGADARLPPAELDTTVKNDLVYWSKVIRDANIKAD